MLARLISSTSGASVVTGGLLMMMAGLIAVQRGPLITEPRIYELPAIRFEPPVQEIVPRTLPPEPSDVDPTPPLTQIDPGGNGTRIVVGPGTRTAPPTGFEEVSFGIADGDLMAVVTVAPTYPRAAATRGLEGYVVVEFTVTANGSVDDVRVTESTHSVFERAAIDAVSKFRFRPRIVDGQPVAVGAVTRRITFKLDG